MQFPTKALISILIGCMGVCTIVGTAQARGHRPHSTSIHSTRVRFHTARVHSAPKASHRTSHFRSTGHRSGYSYGVKRDRSGHIRRSEEAKHKFMKMTGYPNGRKGYVVGHIIPLAKGGKDDPSNMQWQLIEEAKQKDKWERK